MTIKEHNKHKSKDAFITNISTVTVTYNIVIPVLGLCVIYKLR